MSKPIGTKDKSKGNKVGFKPKDRGVAKRGNQWNNSPQQTLFMSLWLTPSNVDTFGNAYQSALQAGYSENYARQICSPAVAGQWIDQYLQKLDLTDSHIKAGITALAINKNVNSKSPADTNLKAYETLARINNMLDNKQNTTINIVQPILGGASVEPITVKNEA